MRQYEQIQTRKAISSYGGVGSIIETRDGSILIDNFNLSEKQAWCVAYQIHNNIEAYKIAMKEYNEK